MKLKAIRVEKYRSIVRTQDLRLDDGLTVILGPNNEGKSNLLRALVLAMECLKSIRMPYRGVNERSGREIPVKLHSRAYEWDVDYPVGLQSKHPQGQTTLTLVFTLSEAEREHFKKSCGSAINADLPIEISIDNNRVVTFKSKKQGPGGNTFGKKSKEIAEFISRMFDFQYIPSIRPSGLSLEVVAGLLERELAQLSNDDSYREAIQTIDNLQRPVLDRLGEDVQRHLRHLLPSIQTVRIDSIQTDRYANRMRLPKLIVDDGTATELDAKGDGVKSLAAISLMRASKTGGPAGDLVVAIEEPESHLHPGAVRQLAEVLQEMAHEHQVIITTHSPLLVARDRLTSNIIVSKSKATPAKSIKDVRESLGVRVDDALSVAEYVIVLEGKHDVTALSSLFASRSSEFAMNLRKGKVVFDHMEGASKVAYKIDNLRLNLVQPIIIADDDKAGRECLTKASKKVGLESKYIFVWKRTGCSETELEDLFDPVLYWAELQKQLGVTLDMKSFHTAKSKWSDRMKTQFEAGGKHWSSNMENQAKALVADCVFNDPSKALAASHGILVDNVISSLNRLISRA